MLTYLMQLVLKLIASGGELTELVLGQKSTLRTVG